MSSVPNWWLPGWPGLAAGVLALGVASAAGQPAGATDAQLFPDKFLQLGTGPQGGAFRPIGESVCEAVNSERRETLVRCVTVGTAGSTFNLNAVANGSLQLGLSQEDLLAQMHRDPAQPRGSALREVGTLHTSPIGIMVRPGSGITELKQVAGKVMNLGNRGSGQFAVTAALLRALDLRLEELASATYLATSEFEAALCAGRVDLVVEALAHPAATFEKLHACGGRLLPIPPAVAARMMADNPWLSAMTIPAGTYAGQSAAVSTVGMRNVLFTSADVGEEAVFRLASVLRRRESELKAGQPLLRSMTGLDASRQARAAPLHPGAARALGLGVARGVAP